MQPSIPIATDNIYKFVALFGILILISAMLALVYLISRNNTLVFKSIEELRNLEMKQSPITEESNRKYILKGILEGNTRETVLYLISLICFLLISIALCIRRFYFWFKMVQPKQDKLLDL